MKMELPEIRPEERTPLVEALLIAVLQSKAVHEESIALAIPVDDLAKAVEAASARTPLEKEKLTSQGNARAVFLRAAKAAKVFAVGAFCLEKPWQDAFTRFGNVQQSDLTPSRITFLSLLKNKNQEHLIESIHTFPKPRGNVSRIFGKFAINCGWTFIHRLETCLNIATGATRTLFAWKN